jgi:uncharacterized protein (TIGR03435 family)
LENKSGEKGFSLPPPVGGRLTLTNVPLSMLIQYAYHLQDFEVSGTHGWMESERYDVAAKAGETATEDAVRHMLQSLMAERFKLKVHREPKDLPTYALTIAKSGLKMKQSTGECALPSANTISQTPCGGFRLYQRSQLSGEKVPIVELRDILSTLTGRTVIDKTGLNATFDISLKWTPDEVLAVGAEAGAPSGPFGGSLFTALQEQLGLRLESQRGPVGILVVDAAERPSEN